MDNMSLVKKLPPMLSGSELEQALTILPEYDPAIVNENEATVRQFCPRYIPQAHKRKSSLLWLKIRNFGYQSRMWKI